MDSLLPLLPQYSKWIMTILLSLIAIILYFVFKSYARKQVMIAMLLSTIGDFFMTDLFNIGSFSTYPGAAFFIAGHIVYAICFTNLCKQHGWNYKNAGFYIGLFIMISSTIVVSVFALSIDQPKIIMYILILLYISVIGWNLCSNFAYSFNAKGLQIIILPIAIVLFYLTDIWIFLDMLGVYAKLHDIVWYFYPIAQLLLIIFNEPFKKKDEYIYCKITR